jgi:hypothetical protein
MMSLRCRLLAQSCPTCCWCWVSSLAMCFTAKASCLHSCMLTPRSYLRGVFSYAYSCWSLNRCLCVQDAASWLVAHSSMSSRSTQGSTRYVMLYIFAYERSFASADAGHELLMAGPEHWGASHCAGDVCAALPRVHCGGATNSRLIVLLKRAAVRSRHPASQPWHRHHPDLLVSQVMSVLTGVLLMTA